MTIGTVDIEDGRDALDVTVVDTTRGQKIVIVDYLLTAEEAVELGELLVRAGRQLGS